jgi:hypothetical protein
MRLRVQARERWRGLSTADRIALAVGAALLAAGAGIRLWLMTQQRPALLGYPDENIYVVGAKGFIFTDIFRVVGYSLFLRVLHAMDDHLSWTIAVQHGLGLATAGLIAAAVRWAGASWWAAIVPLGMVALAGPQILVEHAILSETFFTLLAVAGIAAAVRAASRGRPAWALVAGVAWGLAACVRLAALPVAICVAVALLVAAAPFARVRRRDLLGRLAGRAVVTGALCLGVLAPVTAYLIVHRVQRGYGGFTRTGAYNLYGRVGHFADCSRFTPPAGTRVLCERRPESQRPGPLFYVFDGLSPAVAHFGEPQYGLARPESGSRLSAFARAAIVHQPGDYLTAVGRDLWRTVAPGDDPFPLGGSGLTPGGFVDSLQNEYWSGVVLNSVGSYWRTRGVLRKPGFEHFLTYERHTRLKGPLMLLVLVLALLAPLAAPRGRRGPAAVLTVAALGLLIAPIAGFHYDWRFVIPSLGPLTAAAALCVDGLARRLAVRRLARRDPLR